MKFLKGTVLIVVYLALVSMNTPAKAQRSIELYGAIGATVVDVEEWAGLPPNNWETLMSGWSLQAFLLGTEKVSAGFEYGYSYLLWYNFPYAGYTTERNVDASRVMVLVRFSPAKLIAEAGAGLYLFDGYSDLCIAGGIGYKFHVAGPISIPVKFRVDFIADAAAAMLTPGLNAGVSYDF